MYSNVLSVCLSIYDFAIALLSLLPVRKDDCSSKVVLMTGNFYADAWIRSQLEPFEYSGGVEKIYFVAEKEMPDIKKVIPLYAPEWMNTVLGKDIARLAFFLVQTIKLKPDIVGGFHLLLNGLFALFCSKLVGARSLYVCGGGIREVAGGGYETENRIFGKLASPSFSIERKLHAAVRGFDFVVVRGESAKEYFITSAGVAAEKIFIITAGMDGKRFFPDPNVEKEFDVVFLGRISDVKQLNILIDSVAILKDKLAVSVVVVGDGPDRLQLEEYTRELGVGDQVLFVGQQDEPERYLRLSKVFVLPSKSEGLSQAMLQAMLCGLPALVANVGDLGTVVENGISGFLLDDCSNTALAERIQLLITDDGLRQEMGVNARNVARPFELEHVGARWNKALTNRVA